MPEPRLHLSCPDGQWSSTTLKIVHEDGSETFIERLVDDVAIYLRADGLPRIVCAFDGAVVDVLAEHAEVPEDQRVSIYPCRAPKPPAPAE